MRVMHSNGAAIFDICHGRAHPRARRWPARPWESPARNGGAERTPHTGQRWDTVQATAHLSGHGGGGTSVAPRRGGAAPAEMESERQLGGKPWG
jgi:hypothetical protein